MYPNRISIVCITAFVFTLGCGGPSATEMYELEQRISANEKDRTSTESALDGMATKADRVTEQLAQIESTESSLDQRLSAIETSLADLKKQLEAEETGPTETESNAPTLAKLNNLNDRINGLEKSLANRIESPRPKNSLIADREKADVDASDVAENSKGDKKPSKKRTRKPRSRGFEATMFSWNVESDGNDPKVIAQQLSETNRYDIFALCEVLPESIELYTAAAGDDYEAIASRSGRNDRLLIIYNAKKFERLQRLELDDINFEYRYRSPLVAHLRDKATGQQLMVMNNHLARGREHVRTMQAKQLVEWARDQNVPIVALGDYNFDYVFKTRRGNDGFDAMLRDNIWKWVEPEELIDTSWFDNPENPDGRDDYEGSMLDFAFVAGAATEWKSECRVIVRPGDFPDDDKTSDHRPYELKVSSQ